MLKNEKTHWNRVDENVTNSLLDRARQGIHCKAICGGHLCKHESWGYFQSQNRTAAVNGLNSSWVGTDIIASQRLSTSLFSKYNLIESFKNINIGSVFNLQERGEHSSCGPDGVYKDTGFSYNGEEDIMRHGINYYEFPWPDMSTPSFELVLACVQLMKSSADNSIVLVHCHAGLGRTGLMIACYLVFAKHTSPTNAIHFVRSHRKGSIQTKSQVDFVYYFTEKLYQLQRVYPISSQEPSFDFDAFMKRQRNFLHGMYGTVYHHVPKHIHELWVRLICIVQEYPCTVEFIYQIFTSEKNALKLTDSGIIKNRSISLELTKDNPTEAYTELNSQYADISTFSARLTIHLIIQWFYLLKAPLCSLEQANRMRQVNKVPIHNIAKIEEVNFSVNATNLFQNMSVKATIELNIVFTMALFGDTAAHKGRIIHILSKLSNVLFNTHKTRYQLNAEVREDIALFFYYWGLQVYKLYTFTDAYTPPENPIAGLENFNQINHLTSVYIIKYFQYKE